MADIKSRLNSIADKNMWAARGATFMAKAKATKAVWFPPRPEQAAEATAATVGQATADKAEQTTGAARTAPPAHP